MFIIAAELYKSQVPVVSVKQKSSSHVFSKFKLKTMIECRVLKLRPATAISNTFSKDYRGVVHSCACMLKKNASLHS